MSFHIDLFSGIGGFAIAAEEVGWETVQFVEFDNFCQAVLNKNFPNVPIHGDIKTFDGNEFNTRMYAEHGQQWRNRGLILTGGFPCQPYSIAGEQLAELDDRALWPEMYRVIREVRPSVIIGENVTGIITLALDEVLADLESEGYTCETFVLPAASLNAPHRRDRVWIIAHSNSQGHELRGFGEDRQETRESKSEQDQWQRVRANAGRTGEPEVIANTENKNERLRFRTESQYPELRINGKNGIYSNTKRFGQPRPGELKRSINPKEDSEWEADRINSFDENRGFDYWRNFPTQPPLCRRNDGVPQRVVRFTDGGLSGYKTRKLEILQTRETIKAYGNAIVPQVAFELFKAIKLVGLAE